jgi:hypothetical protein
MKKSNKFTQKEEGKKKIEEEKKREEIVQVIKEKLINKTPKVKKASATFKIYLKQPV